MPQSQLIFLSLSLVSVGTWYNPLLGEAIITEQRTHTHVWCHESWCQECVLGAWKRAEEEEELLSLESA